ncbi:cytochrome P450 family protein [Streptomyces sp. NBRC 110465]|uniref:cytochrome P450 family protein n=1 Tax=Streptomyces sp. NBRC 110465 TaxID=1897621 RepID=UPI000932ABAC|nr:cytochrome P450 [Streptomyces sp. NBRC 110465]
MPTSTHNTQAPAAGCPYRLDTTGSDIHGEAAALRERGPATRVLLPGDVPAWSVTDPGLIRRLLTHPDISKDAAQHWPAYTSGQLPADWPLRIWVDVRNALSAYGPEHRRLRRPLAAAFTSRRVRALVPQIEKITHSLLDDLQNAGPDETVDLRARFAWRLPLLVAGAILGVGEDLHNDFRDAVGALFATDLAPEQAMQAQARVYELIGQLIEQKKAKPGDDVTSGLITAQRSGDISDTELRDSLVLLIGAGHETTVNALDHGAVNLLTHPGQLARVLDGEIAWDQLTEEVLRHQAPIATIIMRFAVRDVADEPTGIAFARGDALVINYAAAGRDPQTHGPDADRFHPGRATARDHLAFGHGAHLCLGAELARIEIRTALDALFTRLPHLQLAVPADDLVPLPSFISNGHTAVPVRLGRPAA